MTEKKRVFPETTPQIVDDILDMAQKLIDGPISGRRFMGMYEQKSGSGLYRPVSPEMEAKKRGQQPPCSTEMQATINNQSR